MSKTYPCTTGTPHKWRNAGSEELRSTGWCKPPDNIEFFLGTLFASTKENGGRPSLFDAAFLLTRYRWEHTEEWELDSAGMLVISVNDRAPDTEPKSITLTYRRM
jgi:hypothetical protein